MSPAHFFLSALQALLVFAVGWVIGDAILRRSIGAPRRDLPVDLEEEDTGGRARGRLVELRSGAPESALFAIVGFVCFCVALMLGHIASFGNVFSNPVVVPAAALVVLVWGRDRLPRPHVESWWKVAAVVAFAALLLALYFVPALRGGSSVRAGDSPWHLGWTEQLLAGETVPTGPGPESVAHNAYPWGFHSVLATLVRVVPGSSPLVALDALFFVLLTGLPLGAAVLARTISPRAGWAGALALSVVGGFGWLFARSPDFATSPAAGRFGADLVVASPNSVYEFFPPPLPREVGVVLLAAAASLVIGASRRGGRTGVAAGALTGLVGLMSVPMFVSALLWMTVGGWMRTDDRKRALLTWWSAALVVFSTWAVPVLVNYVRLGGFVNITPKLGHEWGFLVAIGSWGLLLPAAIAGVVLVVRSRDARDRALLGFGAATVALMALAIARGIFDWGLAGNATLLHQGRVWPPAHLLAAAFAGPAIVVVGDRLRERGKGVAAATAVVALGVGAASPALASIELGTLMADGEDGFVYGLEEVSDPDAFVQRATEVLGPDDVVSVPGNDELAFLLFQFSGCRLAHYDHPRLEHNDVRIRFRDPATEWERITAGPGYEPTHVVVPAADAPGEPLAEGAFDGTTWTLHRL